MGYLTAKERFQRDLDMFHFSSSYSLLSKKFGTLNVRRRSPGTWMPLIDIPGHRIDDGMCLRRNNIQGLTKHIKINFSTQISNIVYSSEIFFLFWVGLFL